MSLPVAAPRRAVSLAARAASALGATVLLALGAPLQAQPVTLTFNGLTPTNPSGVRNVSNCYVESGIRITVVGVACGTEAALGTWTPDNPLYYTGSPALFNNLGPAFDITNVAGQAFSFTSVDLAPVLGRFGRATAVTFMGMLQGGGSVMANFDVPGMTNTMRTYALANFRNLSSVRVTVTAPGDEPYVQMDNLQLQPMQVVPEPATVVLVAGGLAALAGVARRRRARTA
jgi:hypothetical protein